jgi:hypothetical protein
MNNILAQNIDLSIPFCVLLLKFFNILVLSLLDVFLIALIICIVTIVIRNCFLSTKRYFPVINVSKSVDGGNTYKNIVSPVRIGTSVYLRYDISVKIRGFLSCFQKKGIECELVIPDSDKMKVSIHEISCEVNPFPTQGFVTSPTTRFTVLASSKNSEKMKLILKCDCCGNDESNIYYFLIKFVDKRLNTFYQKTTSLEYINRTF